jgi:hypothetical protein
MTIQFGQGKNLLQHIFRRLRDVIRVVVLIDTAHTKYGAITVCFVENDIATNQLGG